MFKNTKIYNKIKNFLDKRSLKKARHYSNIGNAHKSANILEKLPHLQYTNEWQEIQKIGLENMVKLGLRDDWRGLPDETRIRVLEELYESNAPMYMLIPFFNDKVTISYSSSNEKIESILKYLRDENKTYDELTVRDDKQLKIKILSLRE